MELVRVGDGTVYPAIVEGIRSIDTTNASPIEKAVLNVLVNEAIECYLLPDRLASIYELVMEAAAASASEEVRAAHRTFVAGTRAAIRSLAFWERLSMELVEPLVLTLKEQAAEEEGDVARQAQLAVDAAEALAAQTCAHVRCTSIFGAREADAPHGKRCSRCCCVRYCGRECQKADWRAHQVACRELQARKAARP